MANYAFGTYAWGICDRCGRRVKYLAMLKEWTGLKVCIECFDERHPQLDNHGKRADAEALWEPRPEYDTATDINLTINNIELSQTEVLENSAIGSTIALITADADVFAYSIVSDPDGVFAIVDSTLTVAAALDYETATSHLVTIRATATDGSTYDETFTIYVIDADEFAPGITSSAAISVNENELLAHELIADETVTWTIVSGADLLQFEISGSTLRWASNGTQDFDVPLDVGSNNTYVVTVRGTDGAGNYSEQTITVTVVNVNEAPTDILLTGTEIVENSPQTTLIGLLTAIDPDVGDVNTFTLLDDQGGRFQISGGDRLEAGATIIDYEEAPYYLITIRVTDSGGLTFDKDFVIVVTNIVDIDDIVWSVTASSDTANEGDTRTITVAFTGYTLGVSETASVMITQSGGVAGDFTQTFALAVAAALGTGQTFNSGTGVLTFASTATPSIVISRTFANDALGEADETFTWTLLNASNGTIPVPTASIVVAGNLEEITIDFAEIPITGQTKNTIFAKSLTITPAFIPIVGQTVTPLTSRGVTITSGAIPITGSTVTMVLQRNGASSGRFSYFSPAYANVVSSLVSGKTLDHISGAQQEHAAPRLPEDTLAAFYYEATTSTTSSYQVGIATSGNNCFTVSTAFVPTSPSTAGILIQNGNIKVANVGTASIGVVTSADRVRVAVDPVNGRFWMAKNSGSWNNDVSADPAAGTGSIDISSLGTSLLPTIGVAAASTGTISGHLKSEDWVYAAPSGFNAYPVGRPGFLRSGTMQGADNNTSLDVPYPLQPTTGGTVDVDDLLFLHLQTDVVASTINTPSGWTSFGAALTNGSSFKSQLFWKRADGTETGNLTCTQSSAGVAGNVFAGAMHRFNNVITTGTPFEVYNSAARAAATSFTGLSVTPTSTNRLGVTLIVFGRSGIIITDDNGNWTDMEPAPFNYQTTAGNDAQYDLFVADTTNGVAKAALFENAMGVSAEGNVYVFALIPTA